MSSPSYNKPEVLQEPPKDGEPFRRSETAIVPAQPVSMAEDDFNPERDLERAERVAKALRRFIRRCDIPKINGKRYPTFEVWQFVQKLLEMSRNVLSCRNCGETNYACDCDSGPDLTDRKPPVIFCVDVDE